MDQPQSLIFNKTYRQLLVELDEANKEVAKYKNAYFALAREVEQEIGKALGCPEFPPEWGAETGTVCVGDHVPQTLVQELISAYNRLRGRSATSDSASGSTGIG